MQAVRTTISTFQSFLAPKNVINSTFTRNYVRAFWAQNNDYKGIPGHTRNPPKMYGYTKSQRNVSTFSTLFATLLHK